MPRSPPHPIVAPTIAERYAAELDRALSSEGFTVRAFDEGVEVSCPATGSKYSLWFDADDNPAQILFFAGRDREPIGYKAAMLAMMGLACAAKE